MFDEYLNEFMHELYSINLELAQVQEFEYTPWGDSPGLYLDWGALPPELDPAWRPAFWAPPTVRSVCATPIVPCDDIPF